MLAILASNVEKKSSYSEISSRATLCQLALQVQNKAFQPPCYHITHVIINEILLRLVSVKSTNFVMREVKNVIVTHSPSHVFYI